MASQIIEIEKGEKEALSVGNLESVRDFTDVRDIVEGYKKVIESDFTPGEAFNICSSQRIKMKELLNKLIGLSKKEIPVKEDPERMRLSDMPFSIGSNSKFREAFNWEPKIKIDQTLKDVMDYWKSQ